MDWVTQELEEGERKRLRELVSQWKGPMKESERLLQWGIRHEFRFLLEREGTRLLGKFSKA
jgi:3-methyladenine DNA glycosylase AlkC